MINSDTVKLLRECDAGLAMGRGAIGDVLSHVKSPSLRETLSKSDSSHGELEAQLESALQRFGDTRRRAKPAAAAMASLKTNVKLSLNGGDGAAAEIIYDGCGMGIKSLSRYLNEYRGADSDSCDLARELIALEQGLGEKMLEYL